MFRDKMNLLGGQFQGLNMNPISLEFSQEMTTTKWLMALLAKIDEVIGFTNGWYDEIMEDLENDGILYQKISEQFLSSFGASLTALDNSINNINTILTLLQYKVPQTTLSSTATNYLYSVGETVNSVMLEYNVVKGSNNISKAEIYKNGVLINTNNSVVNGVNSFVDGTAITSDTEYYIKLYDGVNVVSSNKLNFVFVYKAYYGKVNDNTTINEALVLSMTNIKFNEAFNITFNLNDEKIVIVSHDVLTSIIDSENYDIINSFTKATINININNNPIPFNVYTSTDTILDNNLILKIEK